MDLLRKQRVATASLIRNAANRRASIAEVPVSHEPPVQTDSNVNNPSSFKTFESWNPDPNMTDQSNDFSGSNNVFQNSNPYQMAQYNYADPTRGNTYAMPPPSYVTPPYPVHLAQAVPSPYQQQAIANSPVAYADPNVYGAGPQHSWGQYMQALPLPNSLGPQEYNHASALLQLGGRAAVTKDDGSGASLDEGGGLASQVWPSWNMSYGNVH